MKIEGGLDIIRKYIKNSNIQDEKILNLKKKILKWEYDFKINADLNGCESLSEWEADILAFENDLKILELDRKLIKEKPLRILIYGVLSTIIAGIILSLFDL